jgi:hypothetical protein
VLAALSMKNYRQPTGTGQTLFEFLRCPLPYGAEAIESTCGDSLTREVVR